MTDRPESARWLTQAEKDLAVARVKSERLAQTNVVDRFSRKKLWRGFWNPVVLAIAFIFMMNNITVQGLAFFAPTIVTAIYPDYTIVQRQLYTVPPYAVGAIFTVLVPWLSWKTRRRQVYIVATAPLTMMGYIMFLASRDTRVRYAATFFTAMATFSLGPLCNSQAAASVVSDTARSMAIGVVCIVGNIGGLISTWSYVPWDAPDYPIGNGLNLACSSLILICALFILLWMWRDNKKRDRRNIDRELDGLAPREIEDLEWKHPAWRWRP